jgi:hypothetical protein
VLVPSRCPPLEDRVTASAAGGVTAAIDLFGIETIETALALGVAPDRIVAIAAGPNPPGGVRAVFGGDAQPGAIPEIAAAIVAERLTVPMRQDSRSSRSGRPRRAALDATRARG